MTESAAARVRRVHAALSLLTPFDVVGGVKTRIGRSEHGGYVLLTRPKLPDALYSFGVGGDISFEYELATRGCKAYLFGKTVDTPPYEHPNLHFSQASVGATNDPAHRLAPIVDSLRRNGDEGRTDLLLKLDIEGSEYTVLSSTDDRILRCFSQILLKAHWLHQLVDLEFCGLFVEAFSKINKLFTLCHVHTDNRLPVGFVEGFPAADALELTYIRTDLVRRVPSRTYYPTDLDCANDPTKYEFRLKFFPFYPIGAAEQERLQVASLDSSLRALEFSHRKAPPAQGHVAPRPVGGHGILETVIRPLNILYLACHETLEYDDVRMFTEMGHRVFSVGGLANPDATPPLTRPVMDRFYSRDWWTAFAGDFRNDLNAKRISRQFAGRFDLVIVNHDSLWLDLNQEAFSGMPIVFRSVGQSNDHLEIALSRHLDAVHVVRYSQKEIGLPNFCNAGRVIYFAKFLEDYPQWQPGDRVVTFHNSFPTRGLTSVPTLAQYEELARSGGLDLYGFLNNGVSVSRDVVSAERQLELFRTAGLYLYVYSLAASYTLSFIEAMLVGVPIIAPRAATVRSNLGKIADGLGFSAERYEIADLLDQDPMLLWDNIEDVRAKIDALLADRDQAWAISQRLRAKAAAMFDVRRIAPKWQQLFSEIVP